MSTIVLVCVIRRVNFCYQECSVCLNRKIFTYLVLNEINTSNFKLNHIANKGLTHTVRGQTLVVRSDVCRGQILTTKAYPRTMSVKIFLMLVDP